MTLNHSIFQGYANGSTAVLRRHLKASLKILCLHEVFSLNYVFHLVLYQVGLLKISTQNSVQMY